MMSPQVTISAAARSFEGLALGGVAGVDSAVDPDAEEDLGLGGLDGAADVGAGVLPPGDGVALVRGEDVEARCGGVCRRPSAPPV
ncbi:hypothetical protein [Streptomyces sp. NBC_00459]|uniref:hypothetical protein n=1 Tax=Streptomyces sp. NBC_00459 TaxID=2975749 RepID=UPI002E177149